MLLRLCTLPVASAASNLTRMTALHEVAGSAIDGAAYTVVEYRDRDARWRTAVMPSSLLTAKANEFKAELSDRHFRWPDGKFVPTVIGALAARSPKRRIAISMVPGWQGSRYVLPRRVIKRAGDSWECLLADSPNVRLGDFLVRGTLEDWRNGVARYGHLSSRLRLALGAPFAAVVLRRLHLDSFGFHFVGDTSSGKTLCLRVAGSVPGFNSDAGPTSWDGSLTGIEQLALGTRDDVTLLDETDAIEGSEKTKAEYVKLNIFKFSKNQQRLRAGHYVRAHSVQSDTRNIVISSGEDILIEPRRVRGQDVRMIHIPAGISDFEDIFDADDASDKIGKTVQQRETFVSELEPRTREFQGRVQLAFLRRLVNDDGADKRLANYVEQFIDNAPLVQSRRVFARLRRRFAAVYAGTALAIDYEVLPFSKKATFHDIRKCMNDAINLLIENESGADPAALHLSDDQLISGFRNQLVQAKFVRAGRYANRAKLLTVRDIEFADGFIKFDEPGKFRTVIPTSRIKTWYRDTPTRNRLVALLRRRKIFGAGRQADTSARQTKINPYPTKIPCYCASLKPLGLTLGDLRVR